MAEKIESQARFDDESDALRKTLERIRKEAEEEIIRLSNTLTERSFAADSSVATATDRLALQQEMTMLQQTLEVKEHALDHITEECRRLEDDLEDRNLAFERLKQDLERKDRVVRDSHLEADRLRQELLEAKRLSKARAVVQQPEPEIVKQSSGVPRYLMLAGALTLVCVSLALGALFYALWGPDGLSPSAVVQRPTGQASSAESEAEVSLEIGSAVAAQPALDVAAEPDHERSAEPRSAAPTSPPRIGRDRLRAGGAGPAMVVLDGGRFEMGNDSLAAEDFSPAHAVETRPFMIGVHEVTFAEYDRFARATGRTLPTDYGWGRGDRPVVGVSWDDARAYTRWLSDQTNHHYRLPTEAEWELAARAGTTTPFWWGYEMEPGRASCFDCGSRWDDRSTAPVKSFSSNPYGLYDTTGNVMEWVADCYRAGYEGAPADGSARLDGDCSTRVARGGAFNKPSSSMRAFVRGHFVPQTRLNMLGFRVARDS